MYQQRIRIRMAAGPNQIIEMGQWGVISRVNEEECSMSYNLHHQSRFWTHRDVRSCLSGPCPFIWPESRPVPDKVVSRAAKNSPRVSQRLCLQCKGERVTCPSWTSFAQWYTCSLPKARDAVKNTILLDLSGLIHSVCGEKPCTFGF